MIVRLYGMCSGWSSSHVNAESITTDFGTPPAELSGSGSRSSCGAPTLYANRSLLHLIAPVIALAYGSMSSLAGLKRWPLLRLVRPVHAVAVVLAGPHVGQVAVPHLVGALRQLDRRRFARRRPARGRGTAPRRSRSRRRARSSPRCRPRWRRADRAGPARRAASSRGLAVLEVAHVHGRAPRREAHGARTLGASALAASSRLGASSAGASSAAAMIAVVIAARRRSPARRSRGAAATRHGASAGTGMSLRPSLRLNALQEHAPRAHGVEDVARAAAWCAAPCTSRARPCHEHLARARPERRLLAPEREQIACTARSSARPARESRRSQSQPAALERLLGLRVDRRRRDARSPRTRACRPSRTASTSAGSPWLDEVEEGRRLAVLLAHEQQRHVRRQQHAAPPRAAAAPAAPAREPLAERRGCPTWSWFCALTTNRCRGTPAAERPCVRSRMRRVAPRVEERLAIDVGDRRDVLEVRRSSRAARR